MLLLLYKRNAYYSNEFNRILDYNAPAEERYLLANELSDKDKELLRRILINNIPGEWDMAECRCVSVISLDFPATSSSAPSAGMSVDRTPLVGV
jgi:hypothetical protein